MKYIDVDKWERKEHFNFFKDMTYPLYTIGSNIDVTNFKRFVKENNLSFYYAMVYAATKVMNEMDEFLIKIRDDGVIKHDKLHPSFTDLEKGSTLFKIVTLEIKDDIHEFVSDAAERSRNQKENFVMEFEGRDDLIYFSCLPWLSFTHVSTELNIVKNDSIPRVVWGKYFKDDNKLLMPISIQVNHALLDGFHTCNYINRLQEYINKL